VEAAVWDDLFEERQRLIIGEAREALSREAGRQAEQAAKAVEGSGRAWRRHRAPCPKP